MPCCLLPLWIVASLLLQDGYDRLAPFTAVRWDGDRPEVRIDGEFHELRAIDGHDVAEIVAFCKRAYRDKWHKRFGEDLVQVLSEMDDPPGPTLDLVLVDAASGKEIERKGVAMTAANRGAVVEFNRAGAPAPAPDAPPRSMPRAAAVADLAVLREALQSFSYLERRGVDAEAALKEIEAGLTEPVDVAAFGLALSRFLARFGDGHSRLALDLDALSPGAYLPCLVEPCGDGFVAFREDREAFVDAKRPYLLAIDGKPIAQWIEAAAAYVPAGSKHFLHRHGARQLRFLDALRRDLRLPEGREVELLLASSAKGAGKQKATLTVASRRPTYGDWPRTPSRILDGNIGYLRVTDMEDLAEHPEIERALCDAMESFRGTRGLIIDVRGNGGGTRDILRLLYPYFVASDAGPRVVNVAALRMEGVAAETPAEGFLADRGMYLRDSRAHDDAARAAIDRLMQSFRPEWKLPDGKFSDWHFLVLRPGGADATYRYSRPVVVLQDAGCFSATDIFLGAFHGLPGVTLLGTPSGGGSGRARAFRLPNSRLQVRLLSMASFRADGRLYDGNGVEPDVVVEPEPGDFIGQGDRVLEAALKRLRAAR